MRLVVMSPVRSPTVILLPGSHGLGLTVSGGSRLEHGSGSWLGAWVFMGGNGS